MTRISQDDGYILRERDDREMLLGKSMEGHIQTYHTLGIFCLSKYEVYSVYLIIIIIEPFNICFIPASVDMFHLIIENENSRE